MTNYLKLNTWLQLSDQSDYNQSQNHHLEDTDTTVTNYQVKRVLTAATTGIGRIRSQACVVEVSPNLVQCR